MGNAASSECVRLEVWTDPVSELVPMVTESEPVGCQVKETDFDLLTANEGVASNVEVIVALSLSREVKVAVSLDRGRESVNSGPLTVPLRVKVRVSLVMMDLVRDKSRVVESVSRLVWVWEKADTDALFVRTRVWVLERLRTMRGVNVSSADAEGEAEKVATEPLSVKA